MLWHEKGGSGDRVVLLLHGLGATAAVWAGVQRSLDQHQLGRWIAADLGGHGQSASQPNYSVGALAADIAGLVQGERELFIVGHSLGVYIALALASRWFGVAVRGIVGLGPKISWPETDLSAMRELAARPVRWFASDAEAWSRYRRVSGLDEKIAPGEQALLRGVSHTAQGWRLAQDPRTFTVAGAPFDSLVRSADCRLILARGEHDSMVSTEELQLHCKLAHEIAGAGHNAHVEKPGEIVGLLETLIA